MKNFKIEIQMEYTTRKNLLNYFGYVRKMSYLCTRITRNSLLRQVQTYSKFVNTIASWPVKVGLLFHPL